MKKYTLPALFFIFLFPAVACAEVRFTEVMYDLEGADAGREWVEVCNTGSDSVDLTGWKFFENGTNHGLTEAQGGTAISSGECAVIADNSGTFLSEHGGFSGVLFDSSFSLANTTETITLRNADLTDVDTFTYNSDMGAAGDGNSLQSNAGSWVVAAPTPGSATLGVSAQGQEEGQTTSENVNETLEITPIQEDSAQDDSGTQSSFPVIPQLFADAGKGYAGVSGGPILFKGQAVGKKGEILANARYSWTFGDGTTAEGKEVYHTYMYPGKYRVVLNVSSGFNSGSDMTIADISTAMISISKIIIGQNGLIELKNLSQKELDISGWTLAGNGREFVIPQDTFILGQEAVIFSGQTTGISIGQGDNVILLYPNRTEVTRYVWGSTNKSSSISAAQKVVSAPAVAKVQSTKVASAEDGLSQIRESGASEEQVKGQLAQVLPGEGQEETNSLYPWLLGLILVAGAGAASVFFIKPQVVEGDENPFAKAAAEYEIVEEK